MDDSDSKLQYFVHYVGWNSRHDEWIERDAIIGLVSATPARPGRTPKRLTKVQKVNGFIGEFWLCSIVPSESV